MEYSYDETKLKPPIDTDFMCKYWELAVLCEGGVKQGWNESASTQEALTLLLKEITGMHPEAAIDLIKELENHIPPYLNHA